MSGAFKAQLMALGDAEGVDLSDYVGDAVLVFVASVEEVRKAAPLFRQLVTLHPGDVLAAPAEALRLAGCAMVGEPTPEALVSGIGELVAAERAKRADLLAALKYARHWVEPSVADTKHGLVDMVAVEALARIDAAIIAAEAAL